MVIAIVGALLAVAPVALPGIAGAADRAQAAERGMMLAGVLVGLVAGIMPFSLVDRDQRAGTLDLLLLARRPARDLVIGRLMASLIGGATLLGQIWTVACLAVVVYGMPIRAATRALLPGAGAMIVLGCCSMWLAVVEGAPRTSRHVARMALVMGPVITAALLLGMRGWWISVCAAAVLGCTALFALTVKALTSYAPADDPDEGLPRRFTSRRMAGRAIDRPVFEASRITTSRPWPRYAHLLVACVGLPLVVRLGSARGAFPMLLAAYVLVLATTLAREALAINPRTSGFAVLAVTPLPSGRILAERIAGKLSLAYPSLIPAAFVLLAPPPWSLRMASAGILLLATAALFFADEIAVRCGASSPGAALAGGALSLVIVGAGFHSVFRFVAAWADHPEASGSPLVLLGLTLLEGIAVVALLWLATRRLDRARRAVA